MKVWINRYALTKGIFETDAEVCEDAEKMCSYEINGYWNHAHGKDWWATLEEAVVDANDRKKKKIAALKKQIKKLEELKFE